MSSNKIALTIDIEDWYHTPAVSGSPFSFYPDVPTFMRNWKRDYDYLTEPTLRILKILDEFNLKATFFIVADIMEYYPGLIEKITKYDHEIACHGLHHALKIHPKTKKALLSKTEFEERTGLARKRLQDITGQNVNGYRAPGAYIGHWMFDSLMDIGFVYDSSVYPNSFFIKTDFNIKTVSTIPYIIFHSTEKNKRLIEMPWPSFTFLNLKFPTAGGPFLRFMSTKYIKRGLSESLKNGNTVFYFHPIDITFQKLPTLASRNIKRPFFFNTSGEKTNKKLLTILSYYNIYWTTCNNLINDVSLI
jgi:hypothetical protein